MRGLTELLEQKEPAWPLVQEWIRSATNPVEVLPPSDPQRGEALVRLQVTTRSPMGAVVYESGGLLVDYGWLRILGSGHPRLLRSLPEWNYGRTWTDPHRPPPLLLVADDVAGGFFALNGGGLSGPSGNTFYFAPDNLQWEDLGFGYTDFLRWALMGDLSQYYENCRWPGWETEVQHMHGGQALSIYPFLWAKGPPMAERARGLVPVEEVYGVQQDIARQLGLD
jgi:hypothetical protein